jgi:molybdopterin synthase sulfur carrier subunit
VAKPQPEPTEVAVLRLFAAAREAAGTGRDVIDGETVGELLVVARSRYGEPFAAVLYRCQIWVNGTPAGPATLIGPHDEVAVLPPVSGGVGPTPEGRR